MKNNIMKNVIIQKTIKNISEELKDLLEDENIFLDDATRERLIFINHRLINLLELK